MGGGAFVRRATAIRRSARGRSAATPVTSSFLGMSSSCDNRLPLAGLDTDVGALVVLLREASTAAESRPSAVSADSAPLPLALAPMRSARPLEEVRDSRRHAIVRSDVVRVQHHVPSRPSTRQTVSNLSASKSVRLLLRAGKMPATWVDRVTRRAVRVNARLARSLQRAVQLHAMAGAEACLRNLTGALRDVAQSQLKEAVVVLDDGEVDVDHAGLWVHARHHAVVVVASAAKMVVVRLKVAAHAGAPDEVALLGLEGCPALRSGGCDLRLQAGAGVFEARAGGEMGLPVYSRGRVVRGELDHVRAAEEAALAWFQQHDVGRRWHKKAGEERGKKERHRAKAHVGEMSSRPRSVDDCVPCAEAGYSDGNGVSGISLF